MVALWSLVGCAPSGANAWEGAFELTSYEHGEVPEPTTTTTTPPPTGTSTTPPPETTTTAPTSSAGRTSVDAAGCPATADADWGSAGFAILVDPLDGSWFVQVIPCDSADVCDGFPWVGGGAVDLDESGGTAKFAATSFLALPTGGGECDMQWFTLGIGGTTDAPALDLVEETATTELTTGTALDCEDQLDEAPPRTCSSHGVLSGRRW